MQRVVLRLTDDALGAISAMANLDHVDPAEVFGDKRFALITFEEDVFELTIKFMEEESIFELVKQDSAIQVLM
jgi:hypothetical protein